MGVSERRRSKSSFKRGGDISALPNDRRHLVQQHQATQHVTAAGTRINPSPNEAERNRGFRILHQRAELEIDLTGKELHGKTKITIMPTHSKLVAVKLNARRMMVLDVMVNGTSCMWDHRSMLDDSGLVHTVVAPEFKLRVDELQEEVCKRCERVETYMNAELTIPLPENVAETVKQEWGQVDAAYEQLMAKEAQSKADKKGGRSAALEAEKVRDTKNFEVMLKQALADASTVEIQVEYRCLDADNMLGVQFWNDQADEPGESYMYAEGRMGQIRGWLPCVDTGDMWDRIFFEIYLSVRESKEHDPRKQTVALCSGDLVDVAYRPLFNPTSPRCNGEAGLLDSGKANSNPDMLALDRSNNVPMDIDSSHGRLPTSERLKTYVYVSKRACLPRDLSIAVGEFCVLPDPKFPRNITYFFGSQHRKTVLDSGILSFVSQALHHLKEYYQSHAPLVHVKIVFLDDLDGKSKSHFLSYPGSLLVIPISILNRSEEIDEAISCRVTLSHALSTMYYGGFVHPQSMDDQWLVNGIAQHVGSMCARQFLGSNWYKAYIRDLYDYLARNSAGSGAGSNSSRSEGIFGFDPSRPGLLYSKLAAARAEMICYTVERRIGADVFRRVIRDQLTLSRHNHAAPFQYKYDLVHIEFDRSKKIQNHALKKAIAVEGDTGLLSVGIFLKQLRSMSGLDVRILVRQWVHSASIPSMVCGYRYDAKKHSIELVVKQVLKKPRVGVAASITPDSHTFARHAPEEPVVPFSGTMTFRVAEIDGVHDHTIEIREEITIVELPCHSRKSKGKPNPQAGPGATGEKGANSAKDGEKGATSAKGAASSDAGEKTSTGGASVAGSGGGAMTEAAPSGATAAVGAGSTQAAASNAISALASNSSVVRYVRADPDGEWPKMVQMRQSEVAWIFQLQSESDVASQMEACEALRYSKANNASIQALTAVLTNTKLYYRVRCAAAAALASKPLNSDLDGLGFKTLALCFGRKYMILCPHNDHQKKKDRPKRSRHKNQSEDAGKDKEGEEGKANRDKEQKPELKIKPNSYINKTLSQIDQALEKMQAEEDRIKAVAARSGLSFPGSKTANTEKVKDDSPPAPAVSAEPAMDAEPDYGGGKKAVQRSTVPDGEATIAKDKALNSQPSKGVKSYVPSPYHFVSLTPRETSAIRPAGVLVPIIQVSNPLTDLSPIAQEIWSLLDDKQQLASKAAFVRTATALPNDFEDISEYFVKRAMVRALGEIILPKDRAADHLNPVGVLLQLLVSNDNSLNRYHDEHYVSDLVRAATQAVTSCETSEKLPLIMRVMRFAYQCIRCFDVIEVRTKTRGALLAAALSSITALHVYLHKNASSIYRYTDYMGEGPVPFNIIMAGGNAKRHCEHDILGSSCILDIPNYVDELYSCRVMSDDAKRRGALWLLELLSVYCSPSSPYIARKSAFGSLITAFGSQVKVMHWLFSIGERPVVSENALHSSSTLLDTASTPFMQPFRVRSAILRYFLKHACTSFSELKNTLQTVSPWTRSLCRRVLLIACTEPDPRLRSLGSDLSRRLFGIGVPSCLLSEAEYLEQKRGGDLRPKDTRAERKLSDGRTIKIRAPLISSDVPEHSLGSMPSHTRPSHVPSPMGSVDQRHNAAARGSRSNSIIDVDEIPLSHKHAKKKRKVDKAMGSTEGALQGGMPISIRIGDPSNAAASIASALKESAVRDANMATELADASMDRNLADLAKKKKKKKKKSRVDPSRRIQLPHNCNESGTTLALDEEDSIFLQRVLDKHLRSVERDMVHAGGHGGDGHRDDMAGPATAPSVTAPSVEHVQPSPPLKVKISLKIPNLKLS